MPHIFPQLVLFLLLFLAGLLKILRDFPCGLLDSGLIRSERRQRRHRDCTLHREELVQNTLATTNGFNNLLDWSNQLSILITIQGKEGLMTILVILQCFRFHEASELMVGNLRALEETLLNQKMLDIRTKYCLELGIQSFRDILGFQTKSLIHHLTRRHSQQRIACTCFSQKIHCFTRYS